MSHVLHKFPRTPHLEGSNLSPGDSRDDQVPFADIANKRLVVTEKLDGANCALSFDATGQLYLQARGHYIGTGPHDTHFDMLKVKAATLHADLFAVLSDRFVLYGEWLSHKHTVFYDALPDYFIAFDVKDTTTGEFLSTQAAHRLLSGLPITFAPVLADREFRTKEDLLSLLTASCYTSPSWQETLRDLTQQLGQDLVVVQQETNQTSLAEGLYIKAEDTDIVRLRCKWVRHDFLQAPTKAHEVTHWQKRRPFPNKLGPQRQEPPRKS